MIMRKLFVLKESIQSRKKTHKKSNFNKFNHINLTISFLLTNVHFNKKIVIELHVWDNSDFQPVLEYSHLAIWRIYNHHLWWKQTM